MGSPTLRRDNAPRFPRARGGHVESWFLRANHPIEPRSFWLKATVLVRPGGSSVSEVWCSLFDGDRTVAAKDTLPLDPDDFHPEGTEISLGGRVFGLRPEAGRLKGALASGAGKLCWDLEYARDPSPLGDPLCMLPTPRLIDAPFPKNKVLTPTPLARFEGTVRWGRSKWDVGGWWGMQGHNWGAEHYPVYAWGQCVFLDARGEPFCVAEGGSGRIWLGDRTSPMLSLLVVRRGQREFRFDRLVDRWNHRPRVDFPEWTLTASGRDGDASIAMRGLPERMVCLGYENPKRAISYCLNSKTAAVTLRVNPVDGDAFECRSACGGALEFLQSDPEPRVGPIC